MTTPADTPLDAVTPERIPDFAAMLQDILDAAHRRGNYAGRHHRFLLAIGALRSRLEIAEREARESEDRANRHYASLEKQSDEISALRTELEQVRRDSVRLDWLESGASEITHDDASIHFDPHDVAWYVGNESKYANLREAIDAASLPTTQDGNK